MCVRGCVCVCGCGVAVCCCVWLWLALAGTRCGCRYRIPWFGRKLQHVVEGAERHLAKMANNFGVMDVRGSVVQ